MNRKVTPTGHSQGSMKVLDACKGFPALKKGSRKESDYEPRPDPIVVVTLSAKDRENLDLL